MNFHELERKTVSELRDLAAEHEDVKGVTGLKKEQLLDLLCEKLGIDRHVHVPKGIGRHALKARIRELKAKRDEALAKHDYTALASIRREIKSNKRHLRRVIQRAVRKEEGQPSASS
jgi:hypothetical protein